MTSALRAFSVRSVYESLDFIRLFISVEPRVERASCGRCRKNIRTKNESRYKLAQRQAADGDKINMSFFLYVHTHYLYSITLNLERSV